MLFCNRFSRSAQSSPVLQKPLCLLHLPLSLSLFLSLCLSPSFFFRSPESVSVMSVLLLRSHN